MHTKQSDSCQWQQQDSLPSKRGCHMYTMLNKSRENCHPIGDIHTVTQITWYLSPNQRHIQDSVTITLCCHNLVNFVTLKKKRNTPRILIKKTIRSHLFRRLIVLITWDIHAHDVTSLEHYVFKSVMYCTPVLDRDVC